MSELTALPWKKIILLMSVLAAFAAAVLAYIYVPPIFLYKPAGKYRVAMAGRSVMGQWFRYWNWPYPMRKYALYAEWPIPFRKYVRDGIYMDYIQIAPPSEDMERSGFGTRTMESLRKWVSADRHDALFFKFCFVDFGDESIKDAADEEAQLHRLIQATRDVHGFAREQKIRLILGNALPVLDNTARGQGVRKEYNRWLLEFAKENPEIIIFDFFRYLAENGDTLSQKYAMSPTNSHLSSEAYRILSERLSEALNRLRM